MKVYLVHKVEWNFEEDEASCLAYGVFSSYEAAEQVAGHHDLDNEYIAIREFDVDKELTGCDAKELM